MDPKRVDVPAFLEASVHRQLGIPHVRPLRNSVVGLLFGKLAKPAAYEGTRRGGSRRMVEADPALSRHGARRRLYLEFALFLAGRDLEAFTFDVDPGRPGLDLAADQHRDRLARTDAGGKESGDLRGCGKSEDRNRED